VAATSAGEEHPGGELRPNLDRLTVGVDLGDQGSHYCILGLEGETLAEGQLRTTPEDLATFFQGLNAARVVVEVGTHSAWVQEVIRGCGHEVLVANPRLMDGSKRRKRKNDRIDANKLARLGRVDPESLHPIQHRSREVRQDLVMLRARDALVAARTELINTTRGLVKSMGTRLPKCSSRSFAPQGCQYSRLKHCTPAMNLDLLILVLTAAPPTRWLSRSLLRTSTRSACRRPSSSLPQRSRDYHVALRADSHDLSHGDGSPLPTFANAPCIAACRPSGGALLDSCIESAAYLSRSRLTDSARASA